MIFESQAELRDRIEAVAHRRLRGEIPIVEDTTDYMRVTSGMVLRIDGDDYLVTGEAREGRFGIGDQPKYWVKYAIDLETGARKVVKLVFLEEFTATLGLFTVRCMRSPDKESEVLGLVRGDERFMQGFTARDLRGNNVRVIEHIKGPSLFAHLAELAEPHEEYFRTTFPAVLDNVIGCIEALESLHRGGLQHGDVRNDHIVIESGTGRYRWIDFDFEVNFSDFDVWSVGNVLNYVACKGICTCNEGNRILRARGGGAADLDEGDCLVFFRHRPANVRKIYPYVPAELNEVLMRFSRSTTHFYEEIADIARDLRAVQASGVLATTP